MMRYDDEGIQVVHEAVPDGVYLFAETFVEIEDGDVEEVRLSDE